MLHRDVPNASVASGSVDSTTDVIDDTVVVAVVVIVSIVV
jgi:hypothetical protein